MMIVGLDHVQVAIPPNGEDKARMFYGGLLGMSEIPKPTELAAWGGCWFKARRTVLHLGVQANFEPAQKAHPAFLVTDLQVLYDKLKSAGMPVRKDTALPGIHRFYASDPFGNRLEFMVVGDTPGEQSKEGQKRQGVSLPSLQR